MEIMIELSPEAYDCLVQHAAGGSSAHAALKAAVDIHGYINVPPLTYVVNCDEETAGALLQIAESHCPTAVDGVRKGIKLSRTSRL